MYVVNEEALHGTRSFGEDRSSRVGILEILGYLVGVGERFPAAGIVDDWESVNRATIGAVGSWGNVQLAKDVLDVGRFDPMGAVREAFVVEDESIRKGHSIVHADEKKMWVCVPDPPDVWSPRLGYRRLDVVEGDNGLRHCGGFGLSCGGVAHFNARQDERVVRYRWPDRIQDRLIWKNGTESWVVIVKQNGSAKRCGAKTQDRQDVKLSGQRRVVWQL